MEAGRGNNKNPGVAPRRPAGGPVPGDVHGQDLEVAAEFGGDPGVGEPGAHLGGDEEEGFAVGGTSDVAEGHVVGDPGEVLREAPLRDRDRKSVV